MDECVAIVGWNDMRAKVMYKTAFVTMVCFPCIFNFFTHVGTM